MGVMFIGAVIGQSNMLILVFALMAGPFVLNGWATFTMLKRMSVKRLVPPRVMAGEPLNSARAAMVMVHGRGASAEDSLLLADRFNQSGVAYLAPQAAGHTWYPYTFLAPIADNEPYLSSAIALIESVFSQVASAGIPQGRTMILGFSQGACLTLEYVARHARRYGGVAGLTGGLIGPDDTPRDYAGSLAGGL